MIIALGIVAFGLGTAGGVLLAKFMNLFLKNKINPLIGSAGVSAVPMAARVAQDEGRKADPSNFLQQSASLFHYEYQYMAEISFFKSFLSIFV